MNPEQQAFIDAALPWADTASDRLGIPRSAILAQWADETGWGTSEAYVRGHNLAGVSFLTDSQRALGAFLADQGAILFYPDIWHGLLGYVLRWFDPVYADTRARWGQATDAISVATAIQDSPWAAGHYDHRALVDIIDQNGLTQYDGPVGDIETPPTPGPNVPSETPCGALTPGPAPVGHQTLRLAAPFQTGPDVVYVQEQLNQRGVVVHNSRTAAGEWDGIYGPYTQEAVVTFQRACGLHPDGIVGRQTWCALGVR